MQVMEASRRTLSEEVNADVVAVKTRLGRGLCTRSVVTYAVERRSYLCRGSYTGRTESVQSSSTGSRVAALNWFSARTVLTPSLHLVSRYPPAALLTTFRTQRPLSPKLLTKSSYTMVEAAQRSMCAGEDRKIRPRH